MVIKMFTSSLILSICLLHFSGSVRGQTNDDLLPQNCGQTSAVSQFIIGGLGTDIRRYPWMASLQTNDHICGATILNRRWLLTASHCVYKRDYSKLRVIIGTTDRRQLQSNNIYKVQLSISSNCYQEKHLHDIALLKTDKDMPLDSNPNVSAICLPTTEEPTDRKLFHTGWGMFETESTKKSDVLQVAETELYPEEYCRDASDFVNVGLTWYWELGYKLCVHSSDNSACKGDSGGPLFEIIDGKAHQVGITFHDTSNDVYKELYGYQCLNNNNVLYVKVSRYVQWIKTTITYYRDGNEKGNIKSQNCDIFRGN